MFVTIKRAFGVPLFRLRSGLTSRSVKPGRYAPLFRSRPLGIARMSISRFRVLGFFKQSHVIRESFCTTDSDKTVIVDKVLGWTHF